MRLKPENRWVKKAQLTPLDEIEEWYTALFKKRKGNMAKPLRLALAISVHAANIHDTKSGINPAKKAYKKYSTIQKFCGDDGYRKSFEEDVSRQLRLSVGISKRIKPEFEVLPLRWKVKRTFSWANHSRRHSKDYEINTGHEENMFMISHLHTLLRRYCEYSGVD